VSGRRAAPRRRPRQARSRERVDRVLDAAAALLVAEGWGALTTNRIAREAGVPVGSVYQYFANKEAVVHALGVRALERLDALLDAVLPAGDAEPWEALVDRVLDALADLYRSEPGFRAVWLGPHVSAELVDVDRRHDEALAARLDPLIARACPGLPPADRRAAAALVVQVTGSILALSVRLGPRRGARALAEGKRLLESYLRDRAP